MAEKSLMAQKEVEIFGSFYQQEEACSYTMIIRDYSIKPILGRLAYVEHEEHMHIVFSSSPSNSTRRARRILEHMLVPAEQWATCLRTKQLALFRYMNGRGKVVRSDTFYDNVYNSESLAWPDCSTIPSENRRRNEADSEIARKRARIDLAQMLLDRRISHLAQLNEKFSLEEMAQLMVDFGNSYKETVSMVLANLRQARLKEEREKPYGELLNRELCMALSGKPRHDCSGFPFTSSVRTWLDNLFQSNGIVPLEFIQKLERVMDKKDNKINGIVLYGPTNTGKSLLCKIMTEFLLTGTINRRSENTNFAFENLLDRSVAILEEPKINAANANDMKQLLGGESFEVSVKYKPMQYLTRLPVIVTTNEYLGCRGGFYIGDFNVLDMPVVKTVGASGQFHHEFSIPNPPFRRGCCCA
ncbi:hypothetical protein ACTXT7_017221 [Hymenolepis weldensis]